MNNKLGPTNRPIRPGGNNPLPLLLLVVVIVLGGVAWFLAKRLTENVKVAKPGESVPTQKQIISPTWTAESLPITKTVGSLKVQLSGVTYLTSSTKNPITGETSVTHLIKPDVSFSDHGGDGGWKYLEEVTFDSKTPSRSGGQHHDLDRSAVWRMVIRAVKIPGANFSDEQIITTDWLEPISAGSSETVNREFSNASATVLLTSVHGPSAGNESTDDRGEGKQSYKAKRTVTLKGKGTIYEFKTDGPYFIFENVKASTPFQLDVFAKDRDGRDLDAMVTVNGNMTVVMTKASNIAFRITFVLKEIRETEFFLSPTDKQVEFKTEER